MLRPALLRQRGLSLARELPCLIAPPIECAWQEPPGEVRLRMGIRPRDDGRDYREAITRSRVSSARPDASAT